jgi:hypothetical protein
MRWAGHVACIGDRIGAYRVLVGRSERPRPRWDDDDDDNDDDDDDDNNNNNNEMDLQSVGWGSWTGCV